MKVRADMKHVTIAAACLNQTPMDWRGNLSRIKKAMAAARDAGASILCLPELCITGYGCEDQFHSLDLQDTAMEMLVEVARESEIETPNMAVSVGLPILFRNALFNCAALVLNGTILGFVAKQHLAGDGLHYEPRWFKSWPAGQTGTISSLGPGHPDVKIGDLTFEVGGVRIGYEICEDAWVAERPGAALARKGVDVILNPSASHFSFGKFDVRKRFVIDGSRAFGATYVYANLLGNEAGRAVYDGGCLIASGGQLLAQGPRLSFRDFDLTVAVVDVIATRISQARTSSFRPDFRPSLDTHVSRPLKHPPVRAKRIVDTDSWEGSPDLKFEEFSRVQALALFDYMRKSRTNGFAISMSGGADSSACAVLIHDMVELGIASIGSAEFVGRAWRQVFDADKLDSSKNQPDKQLLKSSLLTCVYQGTANSSETTRSAAQLVAEACGARFHSVDIDFLVRSYAGLGKEVLGRDLTWETDDVTLQNVQARVRSPAIWLVANAMNLLLLATSNRSEAAVGYCTMDGDTSGSLSPIAGIDKAFLRHWLVWRQSFGPGRLPGIQELGLVNSQKPTAELRPLSSHQTDEEDLMPYSVLDEIERMAIIGKKSPVDIFQELCDDSRDPLQVAKWVDKFFRLWCRNQWKRERYAPSFHVDSENLDPRSWCRFPILSGGFELELEKMWAAARPASK